VSLQTFLPGSFSEKAPTNVEEFLLGSSGGSIGIEEALEWASASALATVFGVATLFAWFVLLILLGCSNY